jgi:hypothetical protein
MACEISAENLRPKSLRPNLIIRMIKLIVRATKFLATASKRADMEECMSTNPTASRISLVFPNNAPQPIKDALSRFANARKTFMSGHSTSGTSYISCFATGSEESDVHENRR